MPYEYRKLTQEEKHEIVALRKQFGYPLHSPPHPFRESGSYLITAANYGHAPVMSSPERRTEFEGLLLSSFLNISTELVGWVVLPNHYHILVNIESLNLVSDTIKHIHGITSREWNDQDGLSGKRKVWYHYMDRMIRNELHLNQSLAYIHLNPLKHKLVENLYDWPWSSLFMYTGEEGGKWLEEHLNKFAPGKDFGDKWDS